MTAISRFNHNRHERLYAVQHAINVDVDTPVDRFVRYLVQRFRIVDDTSIIHDDVKSAEHAPDLVCSAVHRLAVGYVNEQGHDVRRSEEHTSELQSLMRISYAVFCLKKKKNQNTIQ